MYQPNEYSTSNDVGLNAILNTYGASSYLFKAAHPYQPYGQRMISIPGVFPQQFINDLLAYSSVVESVRVSDSWSFGDAVRLQLNDLNIGTPVGFNGNIVVTNNTGLNQIFQNFNVFYYTQSFPSSNVNSTLRFFTAVCNCDKNLLKTELDNYTSVIESTENVNAAYLSNNQFETSKASILPNPFSTHFSINSSENITKFSIFDITGKQIINTSSKGELDNFSSQLNSGIYILKLQFENGQNVNYKLVKK